MTSPGRPRDPQLEEYVAKILALPIGASIFVQDAKSDQFQFLRKPVREAGANIEIIQVHNDAIYGLPGVRVYRREGRIDEL